LDLYRKKKELETEIAVRKKAEEKLSLFRCLIDRSNDAIFMVDPETGSFLDANLMAAESLGCSRNDFLQKKLADIDIHCRKNNALEVLASLMQLEGSQIIESEFARMDGTLFPVEMNCKLLGVKGKKYLVIVSRDITQRKALEKALKLANERLEALVIERTAELEKTYNQLLHAEKLSALGRLSASIAHEINNPLFGIRNVLGGILRRAVLDEEDEELVAMALNECDRMKHLIQNLKDFKRPTQGVMEATNLHKVLDSILLLLNKEFNNKQIKIVKQYAPDLPAIRMVVDQIKQVLLNLIHNAADAITDSAGTITISTEANAGTVAVRIQDTGTGIRPEDLDQIFEPFFTTKPETGTGLGLSVSYDIIKRHQGKLEVKSEAGKGSIFSVILPLTG
jgi:PAS domain S-box-containing protein